MQDKGYLVIKNHGIIAVGESLEDAEILECLEKDHEKKYLGDLSVIAFRRKISP